jgi:predicted O-methyltransferase YrrM
MKEALERWIEARFAPEDEHLGRIRREMVERGFPEIQLPPVTARALQLLLRVAGARRVLEVGTLAGYSALWILRALPPDGTLTTVERDRDRADTARRLLDESGEGPRLRVIVGEASEVLAGLRQEEPFDAVFLDADKEGLPGYLSSARGLLRRGGLLLVDNALWKGRVADPDVRDEATEAVRELARRVAEDRGWDGTILPTGDGLLVAIRRS